MVAGAALTVLTLGVGLAIWAIPAVRNHEVLTGTGVSLLSFLVGHKHPELIRLLKAVVKAIPPPKFQPPPLASQGTAASMTSTLTTTNPQPAIGLSKEQLMSLSWNEVETFYHNVCTKLKADFAELETILGKASKIMGEALPVVDAACSAVGGPVAGDVIAVLTAINSTVNVVESAVAPANQILASGTITATQAANLAVAAVQAVSGTKAAVNTAEQAIIVGRH